MIGKGERQPMERSDIGAAALGICGKVVAVTGDGGAKRGIGHRIDLWGKIADGAQGRVLIE